MDQTIPLFDALQFIQVNHIILRRTARSIALWAANKRVPRVIRRTLKENDETLHAWLGEFRKDVCPDPQLHRKSWYHAGGQIYRCGFCEQLGIV